MSEVSHEVSVPEAPKLLLDVSIIEEPCRLHVPTMVGRNIVFDIEEPGEQPLVDILETVEGRTSGPLMRFLGSVASRYETEDIRPGLIVSRHSLAVGLEGRGAPIVLSGLVAEAGVKISRPRRRK
jgi:hypothetical protein